MDKRRDFAEDLSAMTEVVTRDVGDVLHALSLQKKKATPTVLELDTPARPQGQPEQPSSNFRPNAVLKDVPAEQQGATRREQKTKPKAETVTEVFLQNVTTRIRRDTNALLTEAALRQKLKKASPDTRQDIIETALQEWLKRQGYWKGRVESQRNEDETG